MRRQELPQNRLPAKREVKLDIFMKISAQTGHIQFVARLEIKTTINKHDNEISNKKNGCLFLSPPGCLPPGFLKPVVLMSRYTELVDLTP